MRFTVLALLSVPKILGPHGQQTYSGGDKIFGVDTTRLPVGSVVYDGGTNGLPPGHVSVYASPDDIRNAILPQGSTNTLQQLGLPPLGDPGSYRLPKNFPPGW
jgi:hypothetical protein